MCILLIPTDLLWHPCLFDYHRTILSTEKRSASPSELERLKNGSPLPELNIATTLSLQRGAVGFGNGVMSDSDDDVEVFQRSKSPMEYHQVCITPPANDQIECCVCTCVFICVYM